MTVYILRLKIYNLYRLTGSNPLEHVHGISAQLAFGAMTLLAGHTVHAPEPTSLLNVLSRQALHAFAGPVKPTSHAHSSLPVPDTLFAGQVRHALMLVAAKLEENLLTGQRVHSTLPLTALYVPAGHFSHKSGQILVSTSVPSARTSVSATWLAIELRTYR
jgi:hypothetical protein